MASSYSIIIISSYIHTSHGISTLWYTTRIIMVSVCCRLMCRFSTHQPKYKQYLENNFTRYYITISFLSFFIYLHLYGTLRRRVDAWSLIYEEGWMLDLCYLFYVPTVIRDGRSTVAVCCQYSFLLQVDGIPKLWRHFIPGLNPQHRWKDGPWPVQRKRDTKEEERGGAQMLNRAIKDRVQREPDETVDLHRAHQKLARVAPRQIFNGCIRSQKTKRSVQQDCYSFHCSSPRFHWVSVTPVGHHVDVHLQIFMVAEEHERAFHP